MANLPTLSNARPVDSLVAEQVFGFVNDPNAYLFHQMLPAAEGGKSGTLPVIAATARGKGRRRGYRPGAAIVETNRTPRSPVTYKMEYDALAVSVPHLDALAHQTHGEQTQMQEALDDEVALETAEAMRELMNSRESALDEFLRTSTWNSSSGANGGNDSWMSANADIPAQLQQWKGFLNLDQKLSLSMSMPIFRALQTNASLVSKLPDNMPKDALGGEDIEASKAAMLAVFNKYGIRRIEVSSAAYTPNGSDYIFGNYTYLGLLEDENVVAPYGKPVNPSAAHRICQPLSPTARFKPGRPIRFGQQGAANDFYIRRGTDDGRMSDVIQVLYAETRVQTRAELLLRFQHT